MLVDLKQKSQVTIPKEFVKRLKLSVGDKLDVEIKDGRLIITPVVVVPKDQMWFYSKNWQSEEAAVDRDIAAGKVHEATSREQLFEGLGLDDAD